MAGSFTINALAFPIMSANGSPKPFLMMAVCLNLAAWVPLRMLTVRSASGMDGQIIASKRVPRVLDVQVKILP
jgi:hypothetical protein